MSRPRAIAYAGLVGRYIRMERELTEDERSRLPGWLGEGQRETETAGMEATVLAVLDRPDGVEIVADYGYSFLITEADADAWAFTIWPDEQARKESRLP